MVVPSMATSVSRYLPLKDMCGTKVERRTSPQSGRARKAAPTYANSVNVSHLKTFAIRRYEPQTCSATMATATGTTNQTAGIGTRRVIEAAIAPMSVPALMVLAQTNCTDAIRGSVTIAVQSVAKPSDAPAVA